MAILVDGDGCPDLQDIKKLAKKNQAKMTVFVDYSHYILDDYFNTVVCETGRDSVDWRLLNAIKDGDIVITQDYGLASLALTRGANVIHTSGKIINEKNIEELLMTRYLALKQRQAGKHFSGPKKRSPMIKHHFLSQIARNIKH